MNVHVVIGAGWGDEGKGTIVAKIAKDNLPANKDLGAKTLVVLTNGGAQRGHSVKHDGLIHTYKHFGSGTSFSADSAFGPNFILDPMQFAEEYKHINVREKSVFWRFDCCKWVTPFDILANQEEALTSGRHNTCGMGIWKTIERSSTALYNLSFDDFMGMDYDRKVKYLEIIAAYYGRLHKQEYIPFFADGELKTNLIHHFILDCEFMYLHTKKVENWDFMGLYDCVIFENGQGLAIGDTGVDDQEKTPSFTGLKALPKVLLSDEITDFTVHYVSRTYETRHGDDGSFGSVDRKKISSYIEEDSNNHYNQWQGEFKYNTLNSMLLNKRILEDLKDLPKLPDHVKPKFILELTHCDEIGPEGIVCPVVDKIRFTDRAEVN